MRIGIDIDDTTLVLFDTIIKYADKYSKEELGTTNRIKDIGLITNHNYLNYLYGWDELTKFNFFEKYYKKVLEELPECPNAVNVINKLKSEGNEIYFISARPKVKGCDVVDVTKKSLLKHNINYDFLICEVSNKLEVSKKYNIDVFIDDSYEVCKALLNSGIKAYLKTTPTNKNIKDDEIIRVDDWLEFYELIKNNK